MKSQLSNLAAGELQLIVKDKDNNYTIFKKSHLRRSYRMVKIKRIYATSK